jgi:acyl carrier protein
MEKFNKIAANIFKFPEANITDALSSKDVPDWDSMNYLLFIAELEKEYNISFTMDEVMNAQCIGDIRKIVELRKK